MKLTSAERKRIFRPNVILGRLDEQERRFLSNIMPFVRLQSQNLTIQLQMGTSPRNLVLNPTWVRGMADCLSTSMIDTYNFGAVSIRNELLQAEQIRRAKTNRQRSYKPQVTPFAVDPFTPDVGLQWYQDYALRLVGVHEEVALDFAKEMVLESIANGDDLDYAIENLQQGFSDFSALRLENIARTETAKIYEQSRWQQMDADDEVSGYEFSAIIDSRTSPMCESKDGRKIKKGEEDGWLPPLHYQCRSQLLPVFAWETDIDYSDPAEGVPALSGFGTTTMVIPETARNKIHIGGIPELRKQL